MFLRTRDARLYVARLSVMPSILQQHGFHKGVRTARLDVTSECNPDLVLRVPKAKATAAAITQDRISVFATSRSEPLLLRPRDTLTVFIGDAQILMVVLRVYPLATLCQRRGVIDRTVLLLAVT
jgi:hypothetical protein